MGSSDLDPVAQPFGQQTPAVEVILGAAVLDRDDGEALHQIGQVTDHAVGVDGLALARHHILAALEEFGRGDVQAQVEVLPRQTAASLAGLEERAWDGEVVIFNFAQRIQVLTD